MTLFFTWIYFAFLSVLVLLGGTVAPPSPVREALSGLGPGLFLPLSLCLISGLWLVRRYRRDAEDWIFHSRGANLLAGGMCIATTLFVVHAVRG